MKKKRDRTARQSGSAVARRAHRETMVAFLQVLTAATLVGISCAPTETPRRSEPTHSVPRPDYRQQVIDDFVQQFVDHAMFDGCVLVDVAGEVVYERSFGFAHYELGISHDPSTRFRIASVSKTLTDAAIGSLIEQGVLSRETSISSYLPEFPSAGEITVGHLLDHTSGIPHTNDQPWGDGRTSLTLDEIIERLSKLPLAFPPGTDSSYSNGGYAVLARILEIEGEGPFSEVMRRVLFEPLGMDDTGHIADVRQVIPGMATGYEPGPFPGERRHSRFYAVESRPGGGSFYSTTRDLLTFARAAFREDLLAPGVMADVLGFGPDDDVFLSQGRSPGFVAKLYFDRRHDVIVVSLANSYAVPAGWGEAIATLAMGGKLDGWPKLVAAAPEVARGDSRIGRYRNSFSGGIETIERSERGALYVANDESDMKTGLVPLTDGTFLMPAYFQRCEQNPDTRVITCRMLSGDPRYTSELTPLDSSAG